MVSFNNSHYCWFWLSYLMNATVILNNSHLNWLQDLLADSVRVGWYSQMRIVVWVICKWANPGRMVAIFSDIANFISYWCYYFSRCLCTKPAELSNSAIKREDYEFRCMYADVFWINCDIMFVTCLLKSMILCSVLNLLITRKSNISSSGLYYDILT